MIDNQLNKRSQWAVIPKRVNMILGFINQEISEIKVGSNSITCLMCSFDTYNEQIPTQNNK